MTASSIPAIASVGVSVTAAGVVAVAVAGVGAVGVAVETVVVTGADELVNAGTAVPVEVTVTVMVFSSALVATPTTDGIAWTPEDTRSGSVVGFVGFAVGVTVSEIVELAWYRPSS